jgi:hypothetical protein
MTKRLSGIRYFKGSRAWLAAAALTAVIAVPRPAAAYRAVEVTVVFTQNGQTVMTVTPAAGTPVRYEWVADSGSDPARGVGSSPRNKTGAIQHSLHSDTNGDVRAEPVPPGRMARGAKAVYIVSKTGLRIIKSALFSVVRSLARLYSDA